MVYIQRVADGQRLETVDEVENYAIAKVLIKEYRSSDKTARFYLSQRACKAWRER